MLIRRARSKPIASTWAALATGSFLLVARVLSQTDQQIAESSSDTGTLHWRIENWTEKLTVSRSAGEWLFGSAFGPTPVTERFDSALQFQGSSHNMPIDTLSALGWVGLFALLIVTITAVWRSRSHPLAVLWVLPVALVAYGAFYAWPPWVWVFMGISLTLSSRGQQHGDLEGDSEPTSKTSFNSHVA